MTREELKAHRKALGLTQAELGTELDLTREFVGEMERGGNLIQRRTELAVKYLVLDKALRDIGR